MTEPTYHFIARVQPHAVLYGCDLCGSLVEREDFERHDQWHNGHAIAPPEADDSGSERA